MKSGLFNRRAIYNEIDPFASEWLRRLCSAGNIAPGEVIEGDIADLTPATVYKSGRFHAFAGVGVWDYALRLARWPSGVPVWTGSCPCQPFSVAGKHRGTDDPRHLWPAWYGLIRQCRPPVIFGEQVASPLGRDWLGNVQADMETLGYSFGAADLCAAGVGAPHIRQRLYFVAYADDPKWRPEIARWHDSDRENTRRPQGAGNAKGRSLDGAIPNTGATRGFWENAEWVVCRDNKARAIEPGACPVVDGAPGRLGRLRAYGNAIVPQVAATFIEAALRSIHGGDNG